MPAAFRHENMTSSPLLLGELVAQHGQLGFRARDGLFIVFNASPGQTGKVGSASLICWLMVRILREKLLESSDSATTSSRRVSAIKFHFDCRRFGKDGRILVRNIGSTTRDLKNHLTLNSKNCRQIKTSFCN